MSGAIFMIMLIEISLFALLLFQLDYVRMRICSYSFCGFPQQKTYSFPVYSEELEPI